MARRVRATSCEQGAVGGTVGSITHQLWALIYFNGFVSLTIQISAQYGDMDATDAVWPFHRSLNGLFE
jgi:hypothetical protein